MTYIYTASLFPSYIGNQRNVFAFGGNVDMFSALR
jgi:hypothetical protein